MPTDDKPLNDMSPISSEEKKRLLIFSVLDLKYSYSQIKLAPETTDQ